MLSRIKELADLQADFAFETTMASRSFAPFLKLCREDGYSIHVLYIWLHSADLAVARVRQRIEEGGHYIPEKTIRERYEKGLLNLFELYIPVSDYWAVFDNSGTALRCVSEADYRSKTSIYIPDVWMNILTKGGLNESTDIQ